MMQTPETKKSISLKPSNSIPMPQILPFLKRTARFFTSIRLYVLPVLLVLAISFASQAQTGYIYVHSKALNEVGSPNITYSVSGGTTVVPSFILNDDPTQIPVLDMGAAENGRLWAATRTNALYYRDVNSTVWVNTGITGVAKVDGAAGGNCYYINTAGTVFSYDGTTATAISGVGQFANAGGWNDIGSGWTNTPTSSSFSGPALFVVNDVALVYKYSGTGTTWNTYVDITPGGGANYAGYRVDVNPVNGNVYVAGDLSGARTIRQITPAAIPVVSSLGSPVADVSAYRDVAVNQNGEIYAVAYNSTAPVGWFVHKFISGTSWTRELGSFDASNITGGVDNSLWSTMNSGGWNGGSGWTPAAGPYPFYNIFSRAFDGTEAIYIDDERVRTTTGNSQLIPVAPGTYTITETVPGGWDLQKVTVYDPSANSTSSQVAGTATITVAADEVVNVVFQTGELNPIAMTNSCTSSYLETFGVGTSVGTATTAGSFGSPVAGQTSYHYLTGNAPGEDGYYKIVNRANPDFNGWSGGLGVIDHTPGDGALGYMYAVNAGFDKGEFFRRRFTGVKPGASYNFSAWIIDLTPTASVNPNVSFTVFDHATQAVLGTYNTGELTSTVEPDAWQQYGFTFTATSADIDLVISNNGFGGNGNDLAIDDISFELMPNSVPLTTVINTGCGTPGSITVTSPVGSSYEYSIDGINWQAYPATTFNNLAPGYYTISARFIGTTGCTTTKIDFVAATVCGNIWNDVNGDAINNAENSITSGVWVNLVDPITNDVLQSVQVDASGNYSFTGLPQNTSYKIILSTSDQTGNLNLTTSTILNGYVATGTNLSGVASTTNTTGIISVNSGAGGLVQQNFGIQQVPVAVNNTGTGTISQPVTVNILSNDNDPSGTPLNADSVSLILPVGATNPVYDAQGDLIGFTLPGEGVWVYNNTTGEVTFTPATGYTGNPTPITYTVTDVAGATSGIATVTITYPSASLTGTVFNDINGSGTLDASESGTSASTNLYVYLINNGGIVIDSAKVNADGTYTLVGTPNTAYTIELSTTEYAIGTNTTLTPIDNTAASGWVTTGEGSANTNDLTADGTINVTTGGINTATGNNNFGIEQPPVAVPDQSLNNTTGTTVTINPLTNDTDPSGGTLDPTTVSLVPPAGVSGVVTATDANGDIISMTIPGEGTWTVNPTTGAITFTPLPGYNGNPTVIQYNVEDNAGVVSNNATVTINYLAPITITGTIFDDANGNTITDAGEASTSGGTTLYVHLVNAAGIVVDVDAFLPGDILYTLDAGQNLSYTIELSTTQYPVGTNVNSTAIVNTLPTGWITTGENGTGTTDGNPNGELVLNTGTTNVLNQNFGIEQPPIVPNQNYVIPSPSFNAIIVLNGDGTVNSPGPLKGSDPEDGTLGTGNTFTITSLAGMNGNTLIYNGVTITGPITIANYNPALLQVQLTGAGSSQLSFSYTVTDAAGVQDATSGTYTISWFAAGPLPVKLTSFTARLQDCNSILSWITASEENFSHFEIQHSTNGVFFTAIGKVNSKNIATGSSYQFTTANGSASMNYYRLVMVDINGTKDYSQTVQVNGCISNSMRVYPNPARDHIQVEFKAANATSKYELVDIVGQVLQKGILQANTNNTITIRGAATGTYVLKVWIDGKLQTQQINIFH